MSVLYVNEREVREYKGKLIDDALVSQIKEIENIVYRNQQKMLQDCTSYIDIAKKYEMNEDNIKINISSENDWYMICEEKEDEAYIADIAMINGVNAENRDTEKNRDGLYRTYEMTEAIYGYMLKMADEGKKIRFEATEDTSYRNILGMLKKGLITIEDDNKREWENNDINQQNTERKDSEQIIMHDMLVSVNKEKLEKELSRIQHQLEKQKRKRMLEYIDDGR